MDTFNFKRRNFSTSPHLFGLVCMVAGLFVMASPLFLAGGSSLEKTLLVGGLVVVIGLIIITSYGGTMIDLSGKRVKEYNVICGFQTGKWENLPPVHKVKLVANSFLSTNVPNGITPTLSGKVTEYKVLLYAGEPTPALSFVFKKEEQARQKAQLVASKLGVALE